MFDCRERLEHKLPFELRVLEAALNEIVSEMSTEVSELVEAGLPALDALVSRVCTPLARPLCRH